MDQTDKLIWSFVIRSCIRDLYTVRMHSLLWLIDTGILGDVRLTRPLIRVEPIFTLIFVLVAWIGLFKHCRPRSDIASDVFVKNLEQVG